MGLFNALMKMTDPDEVNKLLDGVERAVNSAVEKGEKLAEASDAFGQKLDNVATKTTNIIDTVDKKLP